MKTNKNMTSTREARAVARSHTREIYNTKMNIDAIKAFIDGKATGKTTTTAKALKTRGLANLNMAFGFVGKMRQWKKCNIHRIATDATLLQREINKEMAVLPPPVKGVVSSMANDLLKKKEQKKAAPVVMEIKPVTTWGESEMGLAEDFQEGDQYGGDISEGGSGVEDWEDLAEEEEVVVEKVELPAEKIFTPARTARCAAGVGLVSRGWQIAESAPPALSKEFRIANPPLAASRTPSPEVHRTKRIVMGPRTNQKDRLKNCRKIEIEPRDVSKAAKRTKAFEAIKNGCFVTQSILGKHFDSRLKTRPCRHVLGKKTCRHGRICKFAHCASELCLVEGAFGETCRKGMSCTYFHQERETREQFISRCFPTLPQ